MLGIDMETREDLLGVQHLAVKLNSSSAISVYFEFYDLGFNIVSYRFSSGPLDFKSVLNIQSVKECVKFINYFNKKK
jgi:hypothetical protein